MLNSGTERITCQPALTIYIFTITPRSVPATNRAVDDPESSPLDPAASLTSLMPGPAALRDDVSAAAPAAPIELPEISISVMEVLRLEQRAGAEVSHAGLALVFLDLRCNQAVSGPS